VAPQIVIDRSIDRNSVKNAGDESSHNQQCSRPEDHSKPRTTFALCGCGVSIRIGRLSIIGLRTVSRHPHVDLYRFGTPMRPPMISGSSQSHRIQQYASLS
jgi:hypothetical protein